MPDLNPSKSKPRTVFVPLPARGDAACERVVVVKGDEQFQGGRTMGNAYRKSAEE